MAKYTIRKNRIKTACIKGLEYDDESSRLRLLPDGDDQCLFLRSIDGLIPGANWGRLSFKVDCSEGRGYSVYAIAFDNNEILQGDRMLNLDEYLTDPDVPPTEKRDFLIRSGAKRAIRKNDILLYELSGQYLYIAFLFAGEGELSLYDMVIDSVGDNFMNTFPEVYRERNSFFHRFISVFSSIYNDFDADIEALPKLLDPMVCPEEFLIVYGSWMGINLEGASLDVDVMRMLVNEAYYLSRMKGTKKAIERVLEIILGKPAVVIEHNRLRSWINDEQMELPEGFKTRGVYDVTVMVSVKLTEELRHQIVFMLDQFKPVRTNITVMQMDETPMTDSRTYLDINSMLPEEKEANLDSGLSLDGTVILK